MSGPEHPVVDVGRVCTVTIEIEKHGEQEVRLTEHHTLGDAIWRAMRSAGLPEGGWWSVYTFFDGVGHELDDLSIEVGQIAPGERFAVRRIP